MLPADRPSLGRVRLHSWNAWGHLERLVTFPSTPIIRENSVQIQPADDYKLTLYIRALIHSWTCKIAFKVTLYDNLLLISQEIHLILLLTMVIYYLLTSQYQGKIILEIIWLQDLRVRHFTSNLRRKDDFNMDIRHCKNPRFHKAVSRLAHGLPW